MQQQALLINGINYLNVFEIQQVLLVTLLEMYSGMILIPNGTKRY